jgi:hypothetical protein
VAQTGAELQIVSPPGERFGLTAYHNAIQGYLHGVLAHRYPALDVFRAVAEHDLCLDGSDASDLDQVTESDGPFGFDNAQEFSLRVVNAAADTLSQEHGAREDLEQQGEWTRRQIETHCRDHSPDITTCVPVFRQGRREEYIDLYLVKRDYDDQVIDIEVESGLRLL